MRGVDDKSSDWREKGLSILHISWAGSFLLILQLERFVVHDLHNTAVTCLAWSTNGMRLFSGDNKGSVGCTDVDFYEVTTLSLISNGP